jgi:hypothetical protein
LPTFQRKLQNSEISFFSLFSFSFLVLVCHAAVFLHFNQLERRRKKGKAHPGLKHNGFSHLILINFVPSKSLNPQLYLSTCPSQHVSKKFLFVTSLASATVSECALLIVIHHSLCLIVFPYSPV